MPCLRGVARGRVGVGGWRVGGGGWGLGGWGCGDRFWFGSVGWLISIKATVNQFPGLPVAHV